MNTLARLTSLNLFSALLVMTPTSAQAQPTKSVLPKIPPNTVLNVERQSGTCPKAIGLWTSFRYYEGGGEHFKGRQSPLSQAR